MSASHSQGPVCGVFVLFGAARETLRSASGRGEMADALDLESNGQPCRFKSCRPHQKKNYENDTAIIGFIVLFLCILGAF